VCVYVRATLVNFVSTDDFYEDSPANWRRIYQPATLPVCKMLYFVARIEL